MLPAFVAFRESTLPYPIIVLGHGDVKHLAVENRAVRTSVGVKPGDWVSIRAMVPETIGVAIEVPERVL